MERACVRHPVRRHFWSVSRVNPKEVGPGQRWNRCFYTQKLQEVNLHVYSFVLDLRTTRVLNVYAATMRLKRRDVGLIHLAWRCFLQSAPRPPLTSTRLNIWDSRTQMFFISRYREAAQIQATLKENLLKAANILRLGWSFSFQQDNNYGMVEIKAYSCVSMTQSIFRPTNHCVLVAGLKIAVHRCSPFNLMPF